MKLVKKIVKTVVCDKHSGVIIIKNQKEIHEELLEHVDDDRRSYDTLIRWVSCPKCRWVVVVDTEDFPCAGECKRKNLKKFTRNAKVSWPA